MLHQRSAGARSRLSGSPHVSYLAPARRPLPARQRRWEGTEGGLEPRLAPAQANGPGVGNADGRCRAAHRCRGSHRQRRLVATHAAVACAPGRRPAPVDVVASDPLHARFTCGHWPDLLFAARERIKRDRRTPFLRRGGRVEPAGTQRFSPWTESSPTPRVACVSSMALEAHSGGGGYTNRPSIHARARWRVRLENHAGRRATGRAVDRMLLALRAYEQRAQRRAALHAWLLARSAPTSRTSPRHRPAAAVTTP